MGSPQQRHATLTAFGAMPTPVTITLVPQTSARRLGRALGGLVACWCAALAAAFIPVAHFVLVPGLAIVGVIWAVRQLRVRVMVLEALGACPRCRRQQSFVSSGSSGDQLAFDCPACLTRLHANLGASSPIPVP
jgi:hypothetical protein